MLVSLLSYSLPITHLCFVVLLQMSKDSLAGLGAGLRSLYLEGNQLEEVPDFNPLTGLEVINLAENPLLCDCPLLPLRMYHVRTLCSLYYIHTLIHACKLPLFLPRSCTHVL